MQNRIGKYIGHKSNRMRRTGAVFYMNVKYGQAKGAIASGDTMMSAKTGHASSAAGRQYGSVRVNSEASEIAFGTDHYGTLDYYPVVAGSVVVTGSDETFTDNGLGQLVSSSSTGYTGLINYTTGVWTVKFGTSQAASAVTITYKYSWETKTSNSVPTVNIEITSETVTAEDFPLSAKFTLAAGKMISQCLDKLCEFGRNLNYQTC